MDWGFFDFMGFLPLKQYGTCPKGKGNLARGRAATNAKTAGA